MARLFDNNAANYMSRGSVNLGLNGATECSFAFWLKLTGVSTTFQRCLAKSIDTATSWYSVSSGVQVSTSVVQFEVNNKTTGVWPVWALNVGVGTGIWTRLLLAWKRNAGTGADGVVYVNGTAAATTFTSNGYTNTFTIQEDPARELYYGQNRAGALNEPLNGALAWVCVWNRQLTAQEALIDYTNPRNVTNGLISRVQIGDSDNDEVLGGSMTVNGTLRNVTGNEPIYGSDAFEVPVRPRAFAPGLAR